MSKTLYFGAFLLLIAVVLVSCSSFEVQVHDLKKKHHDGKKHHDKNNNKHHHHDHDLEHPSRRHHNKHSSEYFDENMKPNEAAIKKLLFGDKAHLFNKQQTDMVLNATKTIPVGIALTFAPNFFANLFNVIVLPQIQAIADSVYIPGYNFGLPGPGGQGSIDGVAIRNFDIQIGQLVPTYPSTFNWALNQISVSITGSWSVKWEIKICPCFGGCCFHITLFHCSGPFGVYADDISITGTMNFVQSGTTVQVESPSAAQWHNSPTVNLNIHCGWFIDAILSVLKFFGLNVWGMVQNAINGAITKAFQGGALGAATNKILDDTVNAAFNGIHICGYKFYPGQSFMTIFTHETSDPSSPCLSDILPTPWLQTAPAHDITLLARIETLFPAYLPPKTWDLICLPLPQSWFNLPGGLGSLMRVDDVITCAGLDSNLGIYLVGEIDVTFFVSSEYEVRRQVQPYVREANRIIAAEFAQSSSLVQQQANTAFGKELDTASNSCPFKSGMSKMISGHSSSSAPWWTCANIPLLEKVLSALPACLIALTALAVSYRIFGKKKQTLENKAAPQLVVDDQELSNRH